MMDQLAAVLNAAARAVDLVLVVASNNSAPFRGRTRWREAP